jgi:heat shock protein HslJ
MKNRYIVKTLKLFAIITIFSIGAFAQNPSKNGYSQRWLPVEIYGKKVTNPKAFIEFIDSENRLVGNAGCNRMFGSFKKSGRNITFSGIGTTKMFCSGDDVMKFETDLLRAISQTTRSKKSGDLLKFYAGKKLVAVFKTNQENVVTVAKLEDKKWVLESIENKAVPKLETDAFIVFDKEKESAGGNSSCNSFGGNYVSEGKTLKITEIISTMRACIEDERMNVERQFMNGLQNADRFEIKLGKLYLYQDEKLLLTFSGQNK